MPHVTRFMFVNLIQLKIGSSPLKRAFGCFTAHLQATPLPVAACEHPPAAFCVNALPCCGLPQGCQHLSNPEDVGQQLQVDEQGGTGMPTHSRTVSSSCANGKCTLAANNYKRTT
jgi:hypothetical protein